MSYQVLARKWRPAKFQEMVGQEHVLKALVNALDDDRLHHAYLFTGTRGVGKTSIARLFAKSLNCETGVSSTPCGECSACREIAEGRFVDLIEVDAASRTKVEDTRELMENVQYAPTHGRYKVYLIDEVHMLSTHSFNALLKTLEEPPPHVKFLLATTDPQKLPITILSRCLQFNLKNLIPERIVDHLSFVLNAENISFEEPALWLLARSADGSMRDAMSLTDQAIAFGAGEINERDVRSMLGTIDQRLVYEMLYALASGDAKALLSAVADLSRFSPDYNTVLGDLISVLHRIAIAQTLPEAVDNSMGDKVQVTELAGVLTAEDVQLYYQVALMGRKDLPFVPDPREGLEMVLLRMLAFRPAGAKPRDISIQHGTAGLQESTTQEVISSPVASEPEPPIAETPPQPEFVEPVSPQPETQAVSEVVPDTHEVPPAKKSDAQGMGEEPPPWDMGDYESIQDDFPQTSSAEVSPPTVAPTEPVKNAPVDTFSESVDVQKKVIDVPPVPSAERKPDAIANDISGSGKIYVAVEACTRDIAELKPENWVHISRSVGLSGMTESLATHLSLEEVSGQEIILFYESSQSAMLNETQQQRISDALNDYFQSPVKVEFKLGKQQQETPAQYMARKREERQALALETMRNDEHVLMLQDIFDAQIELSSVTPID
ncbi:DNA polymerase III subunit gamma/tau [Neptuniibacter sp.]|uniref:DNA polymerase III subunit gamma/tau n=1 Tax=Neptuniibacter sp. TaxID=1962643 RepID=UPI003B5BCC9B